MQVNEHAGHARHGKRGPDIDRAFKEARAKPETRVKRPGADESRRMPARPPKRSSPRYGAGF